MASDPAANVTPFLRRRGCRCETTWADTYACALGWVVEVGRPRQPNLPIDDAAWAASLADWACWPSIREPRCAICARATAGVEGWCARCGLTLAEVAGGPRRWAA